MRPFKDVGVLLAAAFVPLVDASLTVSLTNGTITGVKCQGVDVVSYLALPYARPPIGDLRLAPPEADSSWLSPTKPFNATQQGPSCTQFDPSSAEKGPQSEDCLTLNVYAPSNATSNSSLPIKVWIYGGSNAAGGIVDPTWNGCFAAQSSIMVSMNYRLGPLGWLSLRAANLTGNYGFQDQLLALEWVRDNIKAFGGDPKRVMLFGQSAGAVDAFNIAASPHGSALISSAALESGGGRDLPTIERAATHNTAFVKGLNCTTDYAACLRGASVQQLKDAYTAIEASHPKVPGADTLYPSSGFGSDWGPVIDGTIITQQPSKQGVRVPSILGSNADDGSLFVLASYLLTSPNSTQYAQFLSYNFGPWADAVAQVYPYPRNASDGFTAMANVITDYAYKCPAYRGLATAAANNVSVWTYEFAHSPTCDWFAPVPNVPQILKVLGATHTAEIPFVMGLTDNLPPPSGSCNFTDAEKEISAFLLGSWTEMAATGRPSADDSIWPQWHRDGDRGIVVNDSVSLQPIDYSACRFWDKIAARILALNETQSSNSSSNTGGSGTSPTSSPSAKGAASITSLANGGMWSLMTLGLVSVLLIW